MQHISISVAEIGSRSRPLHTCSSDYVRDCSTGQVYIRKEDFLFKWKRSRAGRYLGERARNIGSFYSYAISKLLTGVLWLNSPSSPRPRWVVGTDFSWISHEGTPRWEKSRCERATKGNAALRRVIYLKPMPNWLRETYIYLLAVQAISYLSYIRHLFFESNPIKIFEY